MSLNENIGLLFFRQQDYPSAKRYLARALKNGSTQPGVRFSLAAARLRTGEAERALADLVAIETPLRSTHEYWEERGRAELTGNPHQSEASFQRALDLDPRSGPAWNGIATAAERQGDDEKALAHLIRARAVNPNDVETLLHFGAVCIRRDLGPDAIEAIEKARKLEPGNRSAIYLLARANISVQNWKEARELLTRLVSSDARFAPGYYAIGWLDIRLNETEAARAALKKSLAINPRLAGARLELARVEIADGLEDAAESDLKKVLEQEPKQADGNTLMADLLARKGDLAGARLRLETAVRETPGLASAHFKLAGVLMRLHEPEAAQRERELAARLNENSLQASKTQLRLVLPEEIR